MAQGGVWEGQNSQAMPQITSKVDGGRKFAKSCPTPPPTPNAQPPPSPPTTPPPTPQPRGRQDGWGSEEETEPMAVQTARGGRKSFFQHLGPRASSLCLRICLIVGISGPLLKKNLQKKRGTLILMSLLEGLGVIFPLLVLRLESISLLEIDCFLRNWIASGRSSGGGGRRGVSGGHVLTRLFKVDEHLFFSGFLLEQNLKAWVQAYLGGQPWPWRLLQASRSSHVGFKRNGSLLSPPVVPFDRFSFGECSPTKIDCREKGALILTSLLEDLDCWNMIFFPRDLIK